MAASTRTFQSTHPLRGATPDVVRQKAKRLISIHAPLAGCDFVSACPVVPPLDFNPRTPCGVRLQTRVLNYFGCNISIHAPLAGCDRRRRACVGQRRDFNPRTPCGVRLYGSVAPPPPASFQSTHPLRGATMDAEQLRRIWRISIHAPLAGCDEHGREVPAFVAAISIHAPLAGCDKRDDGTGCGREHFNPRTPCGVRRDVQDRTDGGRCISIHAPLAGCDLPRKAQGQNGRNFNPRTPCGVRPDSTPSPSCSADFNPRAPCGARPGGADSGAPRREFQSTRPLRGATLPAARAGGREDISIHAPLAGRDPKQPQKGKSYEISIHAPLAGRDGRFIDNAIVYKIFQSTRPLRGATVRHAE